MNTSPTLILHHYPTSPFAEKVRLMLGYKNMSWQSVIIPMINPKPDLLVLTGGYRKTPVLQIGADIYCDTALIADVLERLQPAPTLYPESCKGMARTLAQWADSTLFWCAMTYCMQPKGLAQLFAGGPVDAVKAFSEDRKAMSTGMLRQRPQDATATYKSYLRRLSSILGAKPFALGTTPCIADFALYHPLWFTRIRTPALAGILNATPLVLSWMDRMAALGQGKIEKFSATQAIELAAASTPAALNDDVFQDEHGLALGCQVVISAESFGLEPTEGELVAATRLHYTLRRTDARVGTVHVHFPRIGYALKAAVSA
ncbi:glutathione S-transferase [Polaromonas sp.]|nr:glutathione S-transferase [Polaromonas sp.]